MLPRFLRKKAVFLVSLHFEPSLHFVLGLQSAFCTYSLHFVLGLQSAFCILSLHFVLGLQSAFYTDRMTRPYDRFLL